MAFKYINPGYISLLNNPINATEFTGDTYSNTGVAFTQINSSVGFNVPDFKAGDDFWGRFDFYLPSSRDNTIYIYAGVPNFAYNDGKILTFEISYSNNSNSNYLRLYYDDNYSSFSGNFPYFNLFSGEINTIVYHFKFGSNGYCGVNINGKIFLTLVTTRTFSAGSPKLVKLYSTSSKNSVPIYFSNIIFSDQEISPKEKAIALPVSEIYTDMTSLSSGIYVADAIDQTLLATLDIDSLLRETGANSQLTGIAVVGNPAYTTGTNVAALTGISKSDNNITEHNTVPLSESETASAVTGWNVKNSTISDLRNMQLGWKAGA